jgi:hypothetical protein
VTITWTNTTVKLSQLTPWQRNPRRINAKEADRLAQSFDEFGQVETVAIGPDNEVYNGHQRLTVLLKKHGPNYEIEARQSSQALTEKQREKLTVYLHRGAAGEWDLDALAGWDAGELVEWGFDAEEVAGWGEPDIQIPEPQPQKETELISDRFIEIRCSNSALVMIQDTLNDWAEIDDITVNIS